MAPPGLNPGDLIAEKYEVEGLLGRGGMGQVVAATHLALKRRVAIKFMLPQALWSEEGSARFLREARAAASLKSDHSVRIFDFGQLADGSAYLVMERLEGSDLSALIARSGRLPVATAVIYVLQAALGLAEAHACGIVHRDIKPQNLFLTSAPSGDPLVKVLDFGVCKVDAAHTGFAGTGSRVALGSPDFMAPEQMRTARSVDVRADIWSLGCTLYMLLAGHAPFEADSVPALVLKVTCEEPPALSSCVPGVPAALEAVVRRCLAKDPAARPANLAELASSLAPFAGAGGALLSAKVQGVLADQTLALAATEAAPSLSTQASFVRARPRAFWLASAALALLAVMAGSRASTWIGGQSSTQAAPGSSARDSARLADVIAPAPVAPVAAKASSSPSLTNGGDAAASQGSRATAGPALRERATRSSRVAQAAAQRTLSEPVQAPTAVLQPALREPASAGEQSVLDSPALDVRDPRLLRH